MLELAVLVKRSTLTALTEHTTVTLASAIGISENEALVLLSADVIRGLLDRARPEDTRIDDVIMRLAV